MKFTWSSIHKTSFILTYFINSIFKYALEYSHFTLRGRLYRNKMFTISLSIGKEGE